MSTPTPPPYGQDGRPYQGGHQQQGYSPYGQQQYGQPPYAYGQMPPPYGQPQYGYGYGPQVPLAEWGPRAGAFLIDSLISSVPILIGYGVLIANIATRENNTYPDDGPQAYAIILFVLGIAASIGLTLWNRVFRQGRTGRSVGKSALNLRLVDSVYFQPVGAGKSFLREFLSGLFNNACFLNLLWPLWDDQKQTWHDKVMSTYVVRD
ncbi:RDD family protein [Kribbella sp. NPDC049227]|uniref:RDD family protein n=1 Tax=Kribbella sp. NPDC049227 TaxID=3364113 RepID=UPI00371E65FF